MKIEDILSAAISQALNSIGVTLAPSEIKLQATRKEFEGSHTFACFQYAKNANMSPEQLGIAIGNYLKTNVNEVSNFNVIKGFLNIELTPAFLLKSLSEWVVNEQFGQLPANIEKVIVEYSSPNTNKPLHLGHLRNIFLGYSVSNILKSAGYQVVMANLINDRGIHICKSMLAYQLVGQNETPQSSGMKGDHLVGKYYVEFDKMLKSKALEMKGNGLSDEEIEKKNPLLMQAQEMLRKWENGDEETINLWKKMNGWVYEGFNSTYKNIGVHFDVTYYESNTYLLGKEIVDYGLSKNVFYSKHDGSVWIDLTADGLDEKLVQRADGTSVYITQDLGTADLKYNQHHFDKSVYVVGNEQDYHFKVLFLILEKLGKSYAKGMYHLSYGMVDLPSGKMKSREGTVVDADELYHEMLEEAEKQTVELGKTDGFTSDQLKTLYRTIGLGALKYYLLKVDPKKRMMFNPAESIDFHGNTGPFIQYTYARIQSILRKANTLNIDYKNLNVAGYDFQKSEKEAIILLMDYENKVKQAALEYAPSLIANYVYDLAKAFNTFYSEITIIQEEDQEKRQVRLAFSYVISKTIRHAMGLLGIDVPDKM
ncbi:MAG: arginine--tRNA ligase [Bacteroidota bacterium]|nr:arginine--tRNA ligase [Bacteroidota bacterium]